MNANILEQLKEFYAKMSNRTKIIILIALGVVVIASVIIAFMLNRKEYAVLFTQLNQQETSEIVGKLQEMGEGFRLEGTDTILVLKENEPRVKALLVSEGHPRSGLTYDIFTGNINMMSTDFEKNEYKLFDLQERLAGTIRQFSGVKSAIVTITLPREQRYVLEEERTDATAAVHITMVDDATPSQDLVRSIITLVSKAVQGLKEEDVAITDSTGRLLTLEDTQSELASLKFALEREIEESVRVKVFNLLSPVYRPENLRVAVKGNFNLDKRIQERIQYNPVEGTTNGIILNESRGWESQAIGPDAAGVVGTEVNAEVPIYPVINDDGTEAYMRVQNDINYIVSQIKEQIQSDIGALDDLTVSVAINERAPDEGTLAEVRKLIATAAGIPDDDMFAKVAILYLPFATDPDAEMPDDFGGMPPLLFWIIAGVAFLLLLLLVIVMIIMARKRKEAEEAALAAAEEAARLEAELRKFNEEEDILDINLNDAKPTREQELKAQIEEFADTNPQISAQLIRIWLRGEAG